MLQERVEEIYKELETLLIELDPDPVSRGPGYLQDLISRTRGYLNRVSLILHETIKEHHALERELHGAVTVFEASYDELLAEDPRVVQLPSIEDRKAMINVLLKDDRRKIADLKRAIKELGFVEKAVKHRHKDLESTLSNVRTQKSLIDSELRTGASYGDETDTSRGSSYKGVSQEVFDDDELAKLLDAAVSAPSSSSAADTSAPQEIGDILEAFTNTPAEESEEEKEINEFLNGFSESDLLAGIV